jgi:hypothetical protein
LLQRVAGAAAQVSQAAVVRAAIEPAQLPLPNQTYTLLLLVLAVRARLPLAQARATAAIHR